LETRWLLLCFSCLLGLIMARCLELLKATFSKMPKHKMVVENTFLTPEDAFFERKRLLEKTIRTVPVELDVLPASSASETQAAPLNSVTHIGEEKPDIKESSAGESCTQQPGVPAEKDALLGPQQQLQRAHRYRIHVDRMMQGATMDRLNEFLCEQECFVDSIEWIVDKKRRDRLRFAFVNLMNSDSFDKAIDLGKTLDSLEDQDREINGLGKLRIREAELKKNDGAASRQPEQ